MSRINNVIKNAKVGLFFMMITFALGMFSRKIFLDELGPEFIGLTTTLLGIIGFLGLAEMGLSVAVSSTLYKPLAEKNYSLINTTIDFLGKAYQAIGLSMLVLGALVALFLPYFFPGQEVDLSIVYFSYLVFIVTVVIEYIFNYRQIILSADQKNYVICYCRDSLNILKVVLQIAVVKFGMGEYAWLITGLITTSIAIALINRYVKKNYVWLKSTGKSLRQLYRESETVVTKTKQLIAHKIGSFVFSSSDSILVYKFTSLSTVAMIGNYQLVSGVLPMLLSSLKGGMTASIGNYIHDNKSENVIDLFKAIWLLHWTASLLLGLCFFYLIDPFIYLWLGEGYKIDSIIVVMITANVVLIMARGAIDNFIGAYGLFHDVKAPLIEVAINLVVSIALGIKFGAAGVLTGTFVSVFIIIFLWKPYLLYKLKFGVSYRSYLLLLLKMLMPVFIIGILLNQLVLDYTFTKEWIDLLIYAIQIALLSAVLTSACCFINYKQVQFLINKATRK